MAVYVEIYKCRLCGESIQGEYLEKSAAIKKMCDRANERAIIAYHECKNGNIGVIDTQGLKKVGD